MDFDFHEDAEAQKGDQRGHVVHSLRLHVDGADNSGGHGAFYGEEVGYINVTYIPSEVWRELYTGDWGMVRWLSDFTGACGLTDHEHIFDDDGNIVGMNEWLHKDLPQTVHILSKYLDRYDDRLSKFDVKEMEEDTLEMALGYYVGEIEKQHGEDYEASRRFHVDKPRVEFIRVSKDHRRKGYGTALYRKMTEILDRRYGMKLYDGGLQSDEAQAAWEHLVTLDWNDAREVSFPNDDRGKTRYELSMKPGTKAAA